MKTKYCVSAKATDGTLLATDVFAVDENDAITKAHETRDFQGFAKNGYEIVPGSMKAIPTI